MFDWLPAPIIDGFVAQTTNIAEQQMTLMIAGLVLFSIVHFIPSLAPQLKKAWHDKLGEGGYMGSFSLLLILSITVIVFGWKSIEPTLVYLPEPGLRPIGIGLMLLAFVLFVAANLATGIKRFLRHPQLSSVVVWSAAHLMMNGENRSIVLFGWMAAWAILTMITINRREGEWIKAESPGFAGEAKLFVIGAVVYAVVIFLHPYIAGMPVF